MVAANRLIPVRVGDVEIEVEAVQVAGTEATSGRAAKAAGNVLEAFGRAQDAIIEVAKSTAEMIDKSPARDLGFEVLVKPVHPRDLLARLHSAVAVKTAA